MKEYKYETHAHTSEVSLCASISGSELARFYKDMGFSGICITDHFLNGNTRVPRDLSWNERIDMFCSGYENALIQGQKIGIDVFFAWEYSHQGTDFLTYGPDKNWLLNHPEIIDLSINDYFDFTRSEGALIIHAHPFREASYIEMIRLFPRKVDGVEIINACRKDFENERAREFSENYNLLQTAGSDNHHGHQKRLSGIKLNRPLKDISDMISAIRTKEAEIFIDYLEV